VDLEVSQFYPTMSAGLAYWVYKQTQSRYHVLLAYGFIRSLAKADLPESSVGRFASWLGGDGGRGDEPATLPETLPDGDRTRDAPERQDA
jgi:hypothetical protein